MCNRVPKPLDSLLFMALKEGESLKTYSNRYWELFNKIDGDFDDVAIQTFRMGLLINLDLRKSLTMKPAWSMHQLIDRVEKHKKVEDD